MNSIDTDKQKVVIGVDLGGTNTVIGCTDFDRNIISENTFSTNATEGAEKFIERLVYKIKETYLLPRNKYVLEGIGVAAPGADYLRGILDSPANLKWGNVPIVKMIEEYFNIPIKLINDAQAAALGEMEFGAAKGMKNFLVLTLGTGLGAGIVINGELFYGEHGHAGEIGHTMVEKEGRQCNCGRKGCLETYVSATGIKRTVLDILCMSTTESQLRYMDFKYVDAKLINQLALQNDPVALEAFNQTGKILGTAMANMVASYDPQAIILAGGLVEADELLLKPAREFFEKSLLEFYNGKVAILKSGLQNNNAGLLGACGYILRKLN